MILKDAVAENDDFATNQPHLPVCLQLGTNISPAYFASFIGSWAIRIVCSKDYNHLAARDTWAR